MTEAAVAITRDYYRGSAGARWIGGGLRLAERWWPAAARSVGFRLFCTPLPLKWAQSRWRSDPAWRVERWPFERRSLTVYLPAGHGLQPAAGVALLSHGWGGQARQMLPLAQALAANGLQPVLVEMPAHGRSDGLNSSLPQFSRALEYAAARLREGGTPVRVLAAHSLGANAAAHAVSRGLRAERLVLLAPPASPRAYTRLFAHAFGLRESTRLSLQRRVEAREGVLMADFEPDVVGPRVASPTLVVHDRADRINAFADGESFSRAIAQARLHATEGLGHRGVLKDAAVLQAVASFCRVGEV